MTGAFCVGRISGSVSQTEWVESPGGRIRYDVVGNVLHRAVDHRGGHLGGFSTVRAAAPSCAWEQNGSVDRTGWRRVDGGVCV